MVNEQGGRARDNQRQRLYDADDVLENRRVSKAAKRHLIDTVPVAGWHVIVEPGKTKPMKAPTIGAVQAYIDEVTDAAWFRARWGRVHRRVIPGRGSHAGGDTLTVAPYHRRSEAVILHELAHTLTPYNCAWHGPEFAGILLTLVRYTMGADHARELRESFRKHRVKVTMKSVPAVKASTPPSRAVAARRTAKAPTVNRLGLTDQTERRIAAEVIRKQVKAGLFGPSGCKPRAHALATARALAG